MARSKIQYRTNFQSSKQHAHSRNTQMLKKKIYLYIFSKWQVQIIYPQSHFKYRHISFHTVTLYRVRQLEKLQNLYLWNPFTASISVFSGIQSFLGGSLEAVRNFWCSTSFDNLCDTKMNFCSQICNMLKVPHIQLVSG